MGIVIDSLFERLADEHPGICTVWSVATVVAVAWLFWLAL